MIGIDEAQFFGDLYDFCREVADHDGKTVIVAGLDGDYLRFISSSPLLFSMILCPFLCSSPEFLLITLFLVVFHDFIYYNLPLKFNGVPFESGIKCSQEEFWFRS